LFLTTDYVRGNGLGSPLTDAPRGLCLAAIAIALVACLLAGWRGALGIAVAGLVFFLWRRAAVRRIGGFTGDVAGALTELIEVAVLLTLAIR
jgi:adenosylcobinamide-GDP ribazoletransferase